MNINWTDNQSEGFRWGMRQANTEKASRNSWLVVENARRAAMTPPQTPLPLEILYADTTEYCTAYLGPSGDALYDQKYANEKGGVADAFKAATPVIKDQVRVLLGLSAPLP